MSDKRSMSESASMSQPLMEEEHHVAFVSPMPKRDTEVVKKGATRNMLSTLRGVYIPCMLNIFGIILFLRMGWIVGQAGILEGLGFLLLGESVIVSTILSLCAICTNGKMKGGGIYFMISRCLGPEFGGSVGVIFHLAHILAAAQYLKAFGNELKNTFNFNFFGAEYVYWELVLLPSIALLVTFAISWVGAEAYAKTMMAMFVVLFSSILFSFISFWVSAEVLPRYPNTTYEGVNYFTGPSVELLKANLYSSYTNNPTPQGCPGYLGAVRESSYDFFSVFAVFFNAVTGINAGANISGDLANPSKSLPVGSLAALATSATVYATFIVMFGASIDRTALQCLYSVLQTVAIWPPLVVTGIIVSLFVSSLGAIIGASRILQALARDNILPGLTIFGKGSLKGNEPHNALLLTWVICQGLLFVESLNVIAAITTLLMLLSYGVMNLACFLMEISGTPNFRPIFKYYHWSISLFGTLDCLIVMFFINPIYSGIAIGIMLVCFVLIFFRAPETDWGEISQALMYHQVRKYLLRLNSRKAHVKFWRPGLLVLLKHCDASPGLLTFCDHLKKGGLYVIGSVMEGDRSSCGMHRGREVRKWEDAIAYQHCKAFSEVVVAPNLRAGVFSLLQLAGLGSLRPNTLVIGFPERVVHKESSVKASPYVDILRDALSMDKNVLVVRHFDSRNSMNISQDTSIDVWLPPPHLWGFLEVSTMLSVQLAWIVQQTDAWSPHTHLRVLSFTVFSADVEEHRRRVEDTLYRFRVVIPAVEVFSLEDVIPNIKGFDKNTLRTTVSDRRTRSNSTHSEGVGLLLKQAVCVDLEVNRYMELPVIDQNRIANLCLRFYSLGMASLTVLPVSYPPAEVDFAEKQERVDGRFWKELHVLVDGLPPVLMVMGLEHVVATSL